MDNLKTMIKLQKRATGTPTLRAAYLAARRHPPSSLFSVEKRPAVVANMQLLADTMVDQPGPMEYAGRDYNGQGVRMEDKEQRSLSASAFLQLLRVTENEDCLWHLFPHVRALDAAYILTTRQEPPDGVDYLDDSNINVTQMANYIYRKTGAVAPREILVWGRPIPTSLDIQTTITQAQFQDLLTEFNIDLEAVLGHAPATLEATFPIVVPEKAVAVGGLDDAEQKEQRQDRRLQMCIDAGLPMNTKTALFRLPYGVGNVAVGENVTRQAFSIDVKAALNRRESATREGVTAHRT